METLYRGLTQRITRTFFQDNVATDIDALTVTIKKESDGSILTANSIEYDELDISSQKISTGKYYCKITPDADELTGVYVLYWRYTYGSGDSAETDVAVDVLDIRAEDEVPVLSDNYISLDAIERRYSGIIKLAGGAGEALRIGEAASRILDSELDDRFNVPIRVRADTKAYDRVIIQATVAQAIADILRKKGYDERAEEFDLEYEKFKEGINTGRFRLYEEITKTEIGFSSPKETSGNQSTNIELELDENSGYTGDYHRIFKIEIDTAGAIGTATFKISSDAGNTFPETLQTTREDGYSYPDGMYGLGIRFLQRSTSATLALGDSWTIEALPAWKKTTKTKGSIRQGKLNK